MVVTTDRWVADGDAARGFGYLAASVVLGLLAAFAGLLVGRGLVVRRKAAT